MKRPPKSARGGAALRVLAVLMALSGALSAQTGAEMRQPWLYQLLNDSYLLDDCPICGRPSIQQPMRGTFQLRLTGSNPLFSCYEIGNIHFTAGSIRPYTVKGGGTFQIGGEVALVQQMELHLEIDDGFTKKPCTFKNPSPLPTGLWPAIHITLEQTNGTPTQTYQLHLSTAPLRELWFATRISFTASRGEPGPISGGDLISSAGRVVRRHSQFCGPLSPMPPCPDLGLDAVDILPGGLIAFSIEQDIFSERLGPLRKGDALTSDGRILRKNNELLAAFQPPLPMVDAGLDALQIPDNGGILFSVETDVFSKALNVTLHRGDLLSDTGVVLRTYPQLLSAFHPPAPLTDYGLDAFYQWPGGEIWFSTETGFQDQRLGPVQGGDILSDQGYVVFRNLELLNGFAPIEDVADFGLDGLFVISDAAPPPPPALLGIGANPGTGSVTLTWQSKGRVFQVERASGLSAAFEPLSPLIPDLSFEETGVLKRLPRAFYRLRQW